MNSKSMVEMLLKTIRAVEKETAEKRQKDFHALVACMNDWIDVTLATSESYAKDELLTSLVYFRWLELNKNLFWIITSIISGSYHSACRDLRFWLEAGLQAWYLENFPELRFAPLGAKVKIIEIIKEVAGIGKPTIGDMVSKLPLLPKEQERIKELYHTLSGYVHSSTSDLERMQRDVAERVIFAFSEELFDQTVTLLYKVIDVLFYMMLLRFPDIKGKKFALRLSEKIDLPLTRGVLD